VLRQIVNANAKTGITTINKILYFPSLRLHGMWDQHFFGLPLGQSPSKLIQTFGILIILIPIVTAGLQLIQSKMMFGSQNTKNHESNSAKASSDKLELAKNTKKEKQSLSKQTGKPADKQDDFAQVFQTQSLFMLPIIIAYSSFVFPAGISLYWNTFTIFGIIQQYKISGWGGLDLKNIWKKKI